jgi:hypothetical protein
MKHFYLYILLLCFIIVAVSSFTHYYKYYVLQEPFFNNNSDNNSDKVYILLGDSIIKNNSYVKTGKGIDDILNEKTNNNSYCYAKNDSTIVDIYNQIDLIPNELNKQSTTIFLSVGGNDILRNYENNNTNVKDLKGLNPIFSSYKKIIKSIQTKMNESKIVLIDIYYPTNIKYVQYKPILEEWNKILSDFTYSNNMQLINISNILIDPSDFTLNIEPSETGGEKIANNILLY